MSLFLYKLTHCILLHTYIILQLASYFDAPAFIALESLILLITILCYILTRTRRYDTVPIYNQMKPIYYAFLSSFFGSLQNVMFKSVTQLAIEPNAFEHYEIYLCATAAIVLAVSQLSW